MTTNSNRSMNHVLVWILFPLFCVACDSFGLVDSGLSTGQQFLEDKCGVVSSTDGVNVRNEPRNMDQDNQPISNIKFGLFFGASVKILQESTGSVYLDVNGKRSNKWVEISTADNSKGWVAAAFIDIVLCPQSENPPEPSNDPILPASENCVFCKALDDSFLPVSYGQWEATREYQLSSSNFGDQERYWDYFNSDGLFQDGRFGYNDESGNRHTYRILRDANGNPEYEILPRIEGPGYISRIWFTHKQHDNPDEVDDEFGDFGEVGNIRFFFDDETNPSLELPITQFFSGSRFPFLFPLVRHYRTGDGGTISLVPMQFRRSVRITLAPGRKSDAYLGPRLFQISYKKFVGSTPSFSSFSLPLDPDETQAVQNAVSLANQRGQRPGNGNYFETRKDFSLSTGQDGEMVLMGPATIMAFTLLVPAGQEGSVGISLYWDGQADPAVEGTISDLFGLHRRPTRNIRSQAVGVLGPGQSGNPTDRQLFYNYFPMPFISAKLIVHAYGPIDVRVVVATQEGQGGSRRFHSRVQTDQRLEQYSSDYIALDIGGSGRFVGLFLSGKDPDRAAADLPNGWNYPYLESNLNLEVDGRLTLPGTGIEDDFNAGYYYIWYHANPSAAQFYESGCTWKEVDDPKTGNKHDTSMYRFYLTDSVEFGSHFRLAIQHGTVGNNLAVTYDSTAFWYQ